MFSFFVVAQLAAPSFVRARLNRLRKKAGQVVTKDGEGDV
jgi:hypothetical protein